jgi:mitochondrial import receptor subunit TOM40
MVRQTQATVRKPLPYPGPFDGMAGQSRSVTNLMDSFDGFQFSLSKPLTPQFAVNHSILMGTSMIPKQLGAATYNFGANVAYKGGDILLISRIDKMGRMEGRYMHKNLLGKGTMSKIITQLAKDDGMTVCYGEVDAQGSDWHGQCKFGNMGGGTYMGGFNYFQSVTKDTAVGGDMQWLPQRSMCVSRFGARTQASDKSPLTGQPRWTASAEYNTQGKVSFNYVRPVTKRLTMASELSVNTKDRASKVTLGYKYTLAQSIIQGSVNTQGTLKATVKEVFSPMLNCVVSAELDHKRHDCKVGYGINIGQ